MKKPPMTWVDWWRLERVSSDPLLKKNAEMFYRASLPLLTYSRRDCLLDIGCGRGHLAHILASRVREIHGVDISQRNLEICRKKLRDRQNVFFHELDQGNYTDLSFLSTRFSLIICLSVVQYYQDLREVGLLIEQVRKLAHPGARFLIADLPSGESRFSEAWGLLRIACKERLLPHVLYFLVKSRMSDYNHLASEKGLLQFKDDTLHRLIADLHLEAEVLSAPLTLNRRRKHLLIRF